MLPHVLVTIKLSVCVAASSAGPAETLEAMVVVVTVNAVVSEKVTVEAVMVNDGAWLTGSTTMVAVTGAELSCGDKFGLTRVTVKVMLPLAYGVSEPAKMPCMPGVAGETVGVDENRLAK